MLLLLVVLMVGGTLAYIFREQVHQHHHRHQNHSTNTAATDKINININTIIIIYRWSGPWRQKWWQTYATIFQEILQIRFDFSHIFPHSHPLHRLHHHNLYHHAIFMKTRSPGLGTKRNLNFNAVAFWQNKLKLPGRCGGQCHHKLFLDHHCNGGWWSRWQKFFIYSTGCQQWKSISMGKIMMGW